MKVYYDHESVRLTGRWDISDPKCATTTNTGSYVEFSFEGKTALAIFNTEGTIQPCPHLWVQLDGGAMTEACVDDYIRVCAVEDGIHTCRIIFKGAVENFRRWFAPLESKVSFVGFIADKPTRIAPDNRRTIEFVGDSITEGVLIDQKYHGDDAEPKYLISMLNRCYQDDACATYAWLTAEKLNLRPIVMGYGAVGATRGGQGMVPCASEAYPFNYDGSPLTRPSPDFILINHGANDRRQDIETYLKGYEKLLDVIRQSNPNSKIISLSAFCGYAHVELGKFISEYNEKHGTDISYIDGSYWVPVEPLHPARDGHMAIAKGLAPILEKIIG